MESSTKSGMKRFGRKNWPKWLIVLTNVIFWLFLFVCVVSSVLSCIFIRTRVDGRSMQPTININYISKGVGCDNVLINRVKKGERGDIIVLSKYVEGDSSENSHIVKRLIAIEGDLIGFSAVGEKIYTYLIKNGETEKTLIESHSKEEMLTTYTFFYALDENKFTFKQIGEIKYLQIGSGEVFYLGDNRPESKDCSFYGPVKSGLVVGKVELIMANGENTFIATAKYLFKKFWGWFVGVK